MSYFNYSSKDLLKSEIETIYSLFIAHVKLGYDSSRKEGALHWKYDYARSSHSILRKAVFESSL